ncbi:MAG: 4Fe-4S cluster-binding domain-containing protein [Nitrososphaerales archaeon]
MALQKDLGNETDTGFKGYNKTFAIQRCGGAPYEIALRFAGCCLKCGPCFASDYAWVDRFQKNRRVTRISDVSRLVSDYLGIEYPKNYQSYNWLRILGGEPLLNEDYIKFLFNVLIEVSKKDSKKFNNGIIIQTNGIFVGRKKENSNLLREKLNELYQVNQNVKVCIEISIKGTNVQEFELITQSQNRSADELALFKSLFGWNLEACSSSDLFDYNIRAFYNLLEISNELPNFRPTVIAGFGVNETYLLSTSSKERITIIFKDNKPIYHPDFWSDNFKELYSKFTSYASKNFGPLFNKMPMYGIKDDVHAYPFARRALRQGAQIFKEQWYDAKYASERGKKNIPLEESFRDILGKFFYVDNRTYYSSLINWCA